MRTAERDAAVEASEHACPRCGERREVDQEYCLECGLRLPEVAGTVTSLRRRWLRRFGWYPGDWVWGALLALAVAAAGAAAAIALSRDGSTGDGTTVVLTTSFPVRAPSVGTARTPPASTTAPDPAAGTVPLQGSPRTSDPPGRTVWPSEFDGWTIVLISYPAREGPERPRATARRAANAGLPEVGVLDSSTFASLHPGYAVVFSGVYSSRADAEAALTSVRASGFGGAYVREISA
jgi:hypothetical protein